MGLVSGLIKVGWIALVGWWAGLTLYLIGAVLSLPSATDQIGASLMRGAWRVATLDV